MFQVREIPTTLVAEMVNKGIIKFDKHIRILINESDIPLTPVMEPGVTNIQYDLTTGTIFLLLQFAVIRGNLLDFLIQIADKLDGKTFDISIGPTLNFYNVARFNCEKLDQHHCVYYMPSNNSLKAKVTFYFTTSYALYIFLTHTLSNTTSVTGQWSNIVHLMMQSPFLFKEYLNNNV
jgi:energy-converting hydrogenase Eha subunit A